MKVVVIHELPLRKNRGFRHILRKFYEDFCLMISKLRDLGILRLVCTDVIVELALKHIICLLGKLNIFKPNEKQFQSKIFGLLASQKIS